MGEQMVLLRKDAETFFCSDCGMQVNVRFSYLHPVHCSKNAWNKEVPKKSRDTKSYDPAYG